MASLNDCLRLVADLRKYAGENVACDAFVDAIDTLCTQRVCFLNQSLLPEESWHWLVRWLAGYPSLVVLRFDGARLMTDNRAADDDFDWPLVGSRVTIYFASTTPLLFRVVRAKAHTVIGGRFN